MEGDAAVRYRFVCLTRNLTFDTSWDTILVLDGELIARRNGFSRNRPLADFIGALPGLHGAELPPLTTEIVETLQDEVRRVDFQVPEPFLEATFHPMGLRGRAAWPFPENDRQRLVVSPFVAAGFLRRFASEGSGHVLISRADDLAAVGADSMGKFGELYELDPDAEPEVTDAETSDGDAGQGEGTRLHGLHAKLFVMNDGHEARVWTGSANATNAAFNGNVEFLVELRGGRWTSGIEAVLGPEDSKTALRALLRRLEPADVAVTAPLPGQAAQDMADDFSRALATRELTASVEAGTAEGTFAVTLEAEKSLHVPEGMTATARPLSLAHARAVPLGAGGSEEAIARFDGVSYEGLTSFFVFHVAAKVEGESGSSSFVLNVPLEGAPEGRLDAVLGRLLSNKEDFLRFLLLLLAESGLDIPSWLVGPGSGEGSAGRGRDRFGTGQGLLELLLRALARDPDKLRTVSEVVADLRAGGRGDELLPDGFEAVWDAIWAVGGAEVAP